MSVATTVVAITMTSSHPGPKNFAALIAPNGSANGIRNRTVVVKIVPSATYDADVELNALIIIAEKLSVEQNQIANIHKTWLIQINSLYIYE